MNTIIWVYRYKSFPHTIVAYEISDATAMDVSTTFSDFFDTISSTTRKENESRKTSKENVRNGRWKAGRGSLYHPQTIYIIYYVIYS